MKIYVASSWKNNLQPEIVLALRKLGHEVYDFRRPGLSGDGFSWSKIDEDWRNWSLEEYIKSLDHPQAVTGFNSDFEAMQWADVFVLVMPCGRSAHLEAGWAVGQGKPTCILLSDQPFEPELMYKLASIAPDFEALKLWMKTIEERTAPDDHNVSEAAGRLGIQ